jgi:Tfp pilus assembly protein PilV
VTSDRRRLRLARRAALAGFSLLEAMIAMAIGGFGLMAVARLQLGLQAESDLAKQLGEASFIGQRRLEELRAFERIPVADAAQLAAGSWGYGNIASGSQTVDGANASYAVDWLISQPPDTADYKTIGLTVQWTDRQGRAQQAAFSTVIAAVDPSAALRLGIAPSGTPVRKPKDRDLNVPVPARDLGDGTSAFTPPGAAATTQLVFSNTTGLLTKKCNGDPNTPSSWTCSNVDAYLVTGYIGFGAGGSAPVAAPTSAIDLSFVLSEGAVDTCYDDSAAATKIYSGFITYTCVIVGLDHDANPATRSRWSGRSDLVGADVGVSGGDKVCRYTADYNGNGVIDSAEHPASYSQVTDSLENQNFLIIKSSASCPTGVATTATVQHQP